MIFFFALLAWITSALLAKLVVWLQERRQKKIIENHFKTYMYLNKKKYEKEQLEKDSGEDQEIPKRD